MERTKHTTCYERYIRRKHNTHCNQHNFYCFTFTSPLFPYRCHHAAGIRPTKRVTLGLVPVNAPESFGAGVFVPLEVVVPPNQPLGLVFPQARPRAKASGQVQRVLALAPTVPCHEHTQPAANEPVHQPTPPDADIINIDTIVIS